MRKEIEIICSFTTKKDAKEIEQYILLFKPDSEEYYQFPSHPPVDQTESDRTFEAMRKVLREKVFHFEEKKNH